MSLAASNKAEHVHDHEFYDYESERRRRTNEPVVICRCGLGLVQATCAGCGVSYGRIIELADSVN